MEPVFRGSLDAVLVEALGRAADPVFATDRSARILYVNDAACRALGYTREELLGLRIPDIDPHFPFHLWDEHWARVGRTGTQRIETIHRRKDGTLLPVEVAVSPIGEGPEEVHFSFARDISVRVAAQEDLQAAQRRLQTVVSNSQAVIYQLDPEGRFLLSEGRGLVGLGLRPGQVVGLSALDVYQQHPGISEQLRKALVGESSRGMVELEGMVFDHFLTPVMDGEGRLESVIGIATDITEQKRAEEALRRSEERFRRNAETLPLVLYELRSEAGRNTYTYVSEKIRELAGIPAERMVADPQAFLSLLHPDHAQEYREAAEKAARDLSPFSGDFRIIRPDGQVRWIHAERMPREGDAQASVWSGFLRDVTEQRAADQALRESRRRYRNLYDNTPVMLHSIDREGRLVSVSHYWLSRMGYTREEVLGRPVSDFMTEDSARRAREQVWPEFFRTGSVKDMAYELVTKAGEIIETLVSATAERDEEGRVTRSLAVLVDVTAFNRAQEALRASERSYRGLFDSVGQAIYIQDREGRFLDVNAGACAMYGYAREELVGQTPAMVSAPDLNDIPRVMACVAAAFGGEPQAFEFWGLRKNGEVFPKDVRLYPGTYFGQDVIIAIAEDVTERKRAEEALRQSQKLESLGLLAGGIAHDINNLLTAILGNLDMALLRCPEESPVREHLLSMDKTVEKAAELTKQLLAYSGRGRFVVKVHDLNTVVSEMLHLLRVSVSKRIRLDLDLGAELPAIQGDGAQLQQVVMNLLTNASEAVGDEDGVISVSTRRVELDGAAIRELLASTGVSPGTFAMLQVSDTGCGMSREVLGQIFDPFFSTKTAGRGLGLSAMLGILRGHHAGIGIHSEPGRGSVFRVYFPATEGLVAEEELVGVQTRPTFEGKVLLVDDEEDILEATGGILESLGFSVVTAKDGLAALRVFQEEAATLSLVLMDLTMPGMDGRNAFREMHRLDPGVPVVLSSGFDEGEFAQTPAGQGLAGFVGKPYKIRELEAVLQRALARRPQG